MSVNILRSFRIIIPTTITCFALFLVSLTPRCIYASVPVIGAQVWIEPGQTEEDIDRWFQILSDHDMPFARLFIQWNFIEVKPDVWDYTLYDQAFRAAEKHNVQIVATLTADSGPAHRGYPYNNHARRLPETKAMQAVTADYIQRIVKRYSGSPALHSWMQVNEPGFGPDSSPLAEEKFRTWLREKYDSIDELNTAWMAAFEDFDAIVHDPRWSGAGWVWPVSFVDWMTFWRGHVTWFLGWVTEEIRKTDAVHEIHDNPHALLGNLANAGIDLPAWRNVMQSIGASIHPSWHFSSLKRDQFAMGVSYVCDLIRGSAAPLPFWVTELQGGNNLYSGQKPLCPSDRDIAQWTWTSIGAGAERVVYWLLNNRAQGVEAGEWSMLDFQNRPTDRLEVAADIARTTNKYESFFRNAAPVQSPVTILLSLESMTVEARNARNDSPGRSSTAHVKSALAYYATLQDLGIPVNLRFLHDFEWQTDSAQPQVLVLPHVSGLPEQYLSRLQSFAENGNTILMSGMTGFFDEYAVVRPMTESKMTELTGARLKEYRYVDKYFNLNIGGNTLSTHLWAGELEITDATSIGSRKSRTIAAKRSIGAGTVYWIPSLIGLGAWQRDSEPLLRFLTDVVAPQVVAAQPVRFKRPTQDCILRTLRNGNDYLAVVTNGTDSPQNVSLQVQLEGTPEVIWSNGQSGLFDDGDVKLDARATIVILWTGSAQ